VKENQGVNQKAGREWKKTQLVKPRAHLAIFCIGGNGQVASDFVTFIDVISHGTETVVCITQREVITTGNRGCGFDDNCMIWAGRDGLAHAPGFVR